MDSSQSHRNPQTLSRILDRIVQSRIRILYLLCVSALAERIGGTAVGAVRQNQIVKLQLFIVRAG